MPANLRLNTIKAFFALAVLNEVLEEAVAQQAHSTQVTPAPTQNTTTPTTTQAPTTSSTLFNITTTALRTITETIRNFTTTEAPTSTSTSTPPQPNLQTNCSASEILTAVTNPRFNEYLSLNNLTEKFYGSLDHIVHNVTQFQDNVRHVANSSLEQAFNLINFISNICHLEKEDGKEGGFDKRWIILPVVAFLLIAAATAYYLREKPISAQENQAGGGGGDHTNTSRRRIHLNPFGRGVQETAVDIEEEAREFEKNLVNILSENIADDQKKQNLTAFLTRCLQKTPDEIETGDKAKYYSDHISANIVNITNSLIDKRMSQADAAQAITLSLTTIAEIKRDHDDHPDHALLPAGAAQNPKGTGLASLASRIFGGRK